MASASAFAGGERLRTDSLVGLAFFEESLRTRVGFDAAAARLGAQTTTIYGPKHSPVMWSPETFDDAIRSVASWCDVICLRHADEDAAARARRLVPTPVINCGNGPDEHPTQALVDIYAIERARGGIDGAHIALVGDLVGMRSAHSLALALGLFANLRIRLVAPEGLALPDAYKASLVSAGHEVREVTSLNLDDVDIVYVAGLPAETARGVLSAEEQSRFRITGDVVERMQSDAIILCPLPRVDEIAGDVDDDPRARYFEQSELALYMRMAVLAEALESATPA